MHMSEHKDVCFSVYCSNTTGPLALFFLHFWKPATHLYLISSYRIQHIFLNFSFKKNIFTQMTIFWPDIFRLISKIIPIIYFFLHNVYQLIFFNHFPTSFFQTFFLHNFLFLFFTFFDQTNLLSLGLFLKHLDFFHIFQNIDTFLTFFFFHILWFFFRKNIWPFKKKKDWYFFKLFFKLF